MDERRKGGRREGRKGEREKAREDGRTGGREGRRKKEMEEGREGVREGGRGGRNEEGRNIWIERYGIEIFRSYVDFLQRFTLALNVHYPSSVVQRLFTNTARVNF